MMFFIRTMYLFLHLPHLTVTGKGPFFLAHCHCDLHYMSHLTVTNMHTFSSFFSKQRDVTTAIPSEPPPHPKVTGE